MPDFPQYLFEFSICLAVFYFYYTKVLKKAESIKWKGLYLIWTPFLALLIPILNVDLLEFPVFKSLNSQSEAFNFAVVNELEKNTPSFKFTIGKLLLGLYFLGFAILSFRFMDALWKWMPLLNTRKKEVNYSMSLKPVAFSGSILFAYIFWFNKDLNRQKFLTFLQNRPHFRWRHSLNLLAIELLTLVLWFHPFSFLFKKQLKAIYFESGELFLNTQVFDNQTESEEIDSLSTWRWLPFIPVVILLSGLFTFNLSAELPGAEPVKIADRLANNFGNFPIFQFEKAKPPSYSLTWGELKLDLEKVAAPNGFSSFIEVELKDFQKAINEEIKVLKNEEALSFSTLDISLEKADDGRTSWFQNVDPKAVELSNKYFGSVNNQIIEGDELYLSGKVDDVYLAGVKIKIKDPMEIYEPKIKISPIEKSRKLWGFQVIQAADGNTLVKLDTNNLETHHIIELYEDTTKYKIFHVPNFKTNSRLVTPENGLFKAETIQEKNLTEQLVNFYLLSEFEFQNKGAAVLNWGEMSALPSSQNYTLKEFKKNYLKPMELTIGDELLHLKQFRVVIFPKDGKKVAFTTNNLNSYFLKNSLKAIEPETSIYINQIILSDGEAHEYLPISFVFNIGKKRDQYDLDIAESKGGLKKTIQQPGFITYQNYRLSELISLLSRNERMVFESSVKEPRLDISFQSDYVSNKKGSRIILERLKAQYHYYTEMRFENRKIWVLKSPEDTEHLEPFEFYYNIRPRLEEVIASNNAKGLETLTPGFMKDLANLLEQEFDIIVFDETQLEKAYGLGLDLSSFKNLKSQLEQDYGIRLIHEKRVVKFEKVMFN